MLWLLLGLLPAPEVSGETIEIKVQHQQQPLPEATVTAHAGKRDPKLPAFRGTTDAQGIVRIQMDSTSEGTFSITATKAGFSPQIMIWPAGLKAAPKQFLFQLPAAQSIGGLVKDMSDKPISGARVTLSFPQKLGGARVAVEDYPIITDGEGRWISSIVPAQVDYVRTQVDHPDYQAVPSESPTLERLIAKTDVTQMRAVLTLTGMVTDMEGRPVAGGQILMSHERTLFPGRENPSTNSAPDGSFKFQKVEAGTKTFIIEATGFAPLQQTIEFKPDSGRIEFKLGEAKTLRGKVTDSKGSPIAGASVRVSMWRNYHLPPWEFSTEADGRFAWTNAPADEVRISVAKSGYMSLSALQVTAGLVEPTLVLPPELTVKGSVVDAKSGQPISGFKVTGGWPRSGRNSLAGEKAIDAEWSPSTAKTFNTGKYEMNFTRPLVSGSRVPYDFVLKVEAAGYLPAISDVIPHDAGAATRDFKLASGDALTGTVKLPDGKPATGVTVHYSTSPHNFRLENGALTRGIRVESTRTGPGGQYVVPQQAQPLHLLALSESGMAWSPNLPPGSKVPDLELVPWGTVEGVLKVNGRPAPDQPVALWYPRPNVEYSRTQTPAVLQKAYTSMTDANGRFKFDRVIPGELAVARVVRRDRRNGMFSVGSEVWGACRLAVAQIKPGEHLSIEAGSSGAVVTGKFLPPDETKAPVDWRYSTIKVTKRLPAIPLPTGDSQKDQQASIQKWFWSQEAEPFRIWLGGTPLVSPTAQLVPDIHGWSIQVADDGSFRIDDLPPGEYSLAGYLLAAETPRDYELKPLGHLSQSVTVPDRPANEILQLGELRLSKITDPKSAHPLAELALLPTAGVQSVEVPVEEPTEKTKVTAGMKTSFAKATPGSSVALYVRARIAPGYHIYRLDRTEGSNIPTTLKFALPAGISLHPDSFVPAPRVMPDKTQVYEKNVVFQRTLRVGAEVKPGTYMLKCDVGYQVCNEQACWPPASIALEIPLEVVASP